MTDKLPQNLLQLFAPRPPLRWLEAPDYAPENRKTAHIDSVAQWIPQLQEYKETDVYNPTESWLEAHDRKKQEKKSAVEELKKGGSSIYKPNEDPNIRGDAFKTLVVARLSYQADEHDLEHEFKRYGPIERIRIVKDTHAHEKPNKKKKAHRGYAFVVFEREKDMRAALDSCQDMVIKGRAIKLDVERGRTVKSWMPRRLGGGLGGRGYTKAAAARPMGFGGGYGGGGRGFDGGRGRGRGGFRGGRGGGGFRRDFGDRNGGYGGPPQGAPSGPGGFDRRNGDRGYGGGGGYGGRDDRGYDDRRYGGRDGGGRDRGFGSGRDSRRTGSNMEPVSDRRDRRDDRRDDRREDPRRDFDRGDGSRKRGYDDGYNDSRKMPRY